MASTFNESYTNLRINLLEKVAKNDAIVLDVGCSNGVNGQYLLSKKIARSVDGIELNPDMGEVAKERLSSVYIGSVEDDIVSSRLKESHYDYIILGDVLEHLINPDDTIAMLKKKLKSKGKLIVSLPNVQHVDVFVHVFLKGTFPSNDRGIFDKTHFHFFTKKDIVKLFDSHGFEINSLERVFRFRDALDSKFPIYGGILTRIFKKYYTYQYIITCTKP